MPNLILTFTSVLIGGWVGVGVSTETKLLIAGAVAVFAAAFGNVLNDIIDLPIDLKNNPSRPIPSGEIQVATAKILAILTLFSAIAVSTFLGSIPLLIVTSTLGALYVYSRWLKLTIWSNITVAMIASLSFLFGGVVMHHIFYLSILPLSITYHFSRELIKDIIDIEGDKMFGSRSLPITYGVKNAKYISIITIIIFTLLLPLPYLVRVVSDYYLYTTGLLIPINIYIIRLILQKNDQLHRASTIFKFGMLIALAAIVIGLVL